LGDELLGQGITVAELTTAADTVKRDWPEGVVYWNEEWDPVVNNDTYKHPASALHAVPGLQLQLQSSIFQHLSSSIYLFLTYCSPVPDLLLSCS
jgi:hypothetical protein